MHERTDGRTNGRKKKRERERKEKKENSNYIPKFELYTLTRLFFVIGKEAYL